MKTTYFIHTIFFIACFLCLSSDSFGQDSIVRKPVRPVRDQTTFLDHVYIGTTAGLQLGSLTLIEISPFAGYSFNKYISAGLGSTYQYYRIIDRSTGLDQKGNIYGYRVFGRVKVWENIFAYAEHENLSLETFSINQREWVSNTFVGGGYSPEITDRLSSFLLVLIVVDYSSSQPLYTYMPVIRAGLTWRLGFNPVR